MVGLPRKLYFHEGTEPPSWGIGDQVLAAGGKGIVFRSNITGGTNVVIYNDALKETDVIAAYDPNGALLKNQNSWR